MLEKPSVGRAKILRSGKSLEIQIPSVKNWFTIIFLTAWLGGWFVGEIFAITTILSEDSLSANIFLLFWLTGWSIGGVFCITILLWLIAGLEIVKVENGVLEIGWQIFGLKRSKKYSIHDIRHLALNPVNDGDLLGMNYQRKMFGSKGGVVKFDYGLKTIKFGSGIDEAEGRLMIETFKLNENFSDLNFA